MQTESTNTALEDNILVERCRSGDTDAMEYLILKYQNRIFNTIYRICANREDAAELTQDTFVKVLESIGNFAGRSSFYTWAFRIAVNLTLNHCRKRFRVKHHSLDASNKGVDYEKGLASLKNILRSQDAIEPSVVAENRELCQLLNEAIESLEEEQRAALVLRDIEGMNYEQVSRVLDIPLGTVKSRISRARDHLRGILEALVK